MGSQTKKPVWKPGIDMHNLAGLTIKFMEQPCEVFLCEKTKPTIRKRQQ